MIINTTGGGGTGPSSVSATLTSSGWSGNTQSVTISGLTATSVGTVGVSMSATSAQREAARNAMLCPTSQSTNNLTITADGTVPSVNIPIVVNF